MRTTRMLECFSIGLVVFLAASAVGAQDVDADLVPDAFDNCLLVANGMNEAPDNQVDADGDGYGNACDPDFDQSGYVGLTDFNTFWSCFGQSSSCTSGAFFAALDVNSDGAITTIDYVLVVQQLGGPLIGVSGLSCADPTLITTLIGGTDTPCTP